jgi:hypothetical protein
MSIGEKGKGWGRNVEKRSKKIGHGMEDGMSRAGKKLAKGARTVGRDVETAGKKVGTATEHGWSRAGSRIKRHRQA